MNSNNLTSMNFDFLSRDAKEASSRFSRAGGSSNLACFSNAWANPPTSRLGEEASSGTSWPVEYDGNLSRCAISVHR